MKKKLIFITAFIIVLALIIGGFFYFCKNKKNIGSSNDYVIREMSNNMKIIENEKAGLKVKIPEGWMEKKIDIKEGSVIIYTQDAQGYDPDRIKPPLKNGCIIEVAVAYKRTDFKTIEKEAKERHKFLMMKIDKFETTEVDGNSALKNTLNCVDVGPSIELYIPTNKILYGLRISSGPQEIDKCFQEFDKFLEGVSIK